MQPMIRFSLVLHNHQPIGNFDHVFAQAYEDSYQPFLDVFEQYEDLRISLHTSGPLMEWLDQHRPEYMERLVRLVRAGRIEIVGGAYYEPILTMIPSRDRVGQITSYSRWLNERFQTQVRGMWIPERVWEQSLASDIARSDIRYTVLDDFHFCNAGLNSEDLHGYFVTEDEGERLFVFPGSETLRYLIPFREPNETIDYLRGLAEAHPNAIAVFGDDGEKFGTWPDTKQHVYDNGWLHRFFQALVENKEWLQVTTLGECVDQTPPVGKVYLPDSSYREMTEWSLPVERQIEFDQLTHDMEQDPHWPVIRKYVRGGFWRNFKVKYPESNDMYSRMMYVSSLVRQAEQEGHSGELLDWARRELYRGQCNCSYWHGAFGGIYLPHLRNAVFNHLIAAENLIDQLHAKNSPWVEASVDDYDFDAHQEVRLANDRVVAWIDPSEGGVLYELDVRSICHNLGGTISRRAESYHEKVRAGASGHDEDVTSIHDRVVFKQEGLDERLTYDNLRRFSLVDHFYDNEVTLDQIVSGEALERGDFAGQPYSTRVRRNPDRIQVQMSRNGNAWQVPLKITKGVTMSAGDSTVEIAYLIEGLPQDRDFHFAVEFNLAGLPAGAEDRYFCHSGNATDGPKNKLGDFGQSLDLQQQNDLHLIDEWLGLDIGLNANRPTNIWTYPVESVSQSEGGFELVHQAVAVLPHWLVRADEQGRWSVTLKLNLDTKMAERRLVVQGVELASADG